MNSKKTIKISLLATMLIFVSAFSVKADKTNDCIELYNLTKEIDPLCKNVIEIKKGKAVKKSKPNVATEEFKKIPQTPSWSPHSSYIEPIEPIYFEPIHYNETKKIERGSFIMGDTKDNDNKSHEVKLTYDFYIGKYEVNQMEYEAVMGTKKSIFNGNTLPVENVTWFDAIKYCNNKSIFDGFPVAYNESSGELLDSNGVATNDIKSVKGYRLPTEAEWEFAAKGGKKSVGNGLDRAYYEYAGSNNPNDVAWYSKNSGNKTHEVGSKKPNELELYDMSGNVWEWCTDWYDDTYYNNSTTINPVNTKSTGIRVIRGGGWYDKEGILRVASRSYYTPIHSLGNIGFRLARTGEVAKQP